MKAVLGLELGLRCTLTFAMQISLRVTHWIIFTGCYQCIVWITESCSRDTTEIFEGVVRMDGSGSRHLDWQLNMILNCTIDCGQLSESYTTFVSFKGRMPRMRDLKMA